MRLFWRIYRWIEWQLRGLRCWFTYHDLKLADRGMSGYDDYWCEKCWRNNPNEENTLPFKVRYFIERITER